MFALHHTYHIIQQLQLLLYEAVRKELCECHRGLVGKLLVKQFENVLHELVVSFGVKQVTLQLNVLGHQFGVNQHSVMQNSQVQIRGAS